MDDNDVSPSISTKDIEFLNLIPRAKYNINYRDVCQCPFSCGTIKSKAGHINMYNYYHNYSTVCYLEFLGHFDLLICVIMPFHKLLKLVEFFNGMQ